MVVKKEKEDKRMTIHIHPAENQDEWISLAMNLFVQTTAERLLANQDAAVEENRA